MCVRKIEDLKNQVREMPLPERLQAARTMIERMSSEGRPPRMSIPVRHCDEDFFIVTTLEDAASLAEENSKLEEELTNLRAMIDTPHTGDFLTALPLEAAHQIKRWGTAHDEGKTPFDWFWLVGYLAQKAAAAAVAGDEEKAKHHAISTAACMLNWFRRLTGDDLTFQPGTDAPVGEAEVV